MSLDPAIVRQIAVELIARDRWSREQLVTYQQQRLHETLRRAAASSPYYRDTIGPFLARQAPFQEFPVLTKSMLVANFDRIVTDSRLRLADIERHLASERAGDLLFGEYRACATGGTTGERAVLVYDQAAWEIAAANAARFLRAIGVGPETRVLGIGAPSPLHISNRMFAELQTDRPATPRVAVTTPLAEVVETLNTFQPEVLITYPSFMRRLVEEQAGGRLRISPLRLCSIAEALKPDVRDLVRQTWGIGVIDGFGTTETGMRGMECEHVAGIHLPEDLIVYEVVDGLNRNVPPGVSGSKVLITTLTNAVLPLVRYELTDIVTLASGSCACGRPYGRIASIEGRQEEMLRLPRRNGGYVDVHAGRLRSALIGIPGIRQFQVVLLTDGLDIKISVRESERSEEIRASVERQIRSVLVQVDVSATNVGVQLVEVIERAGTGAKEKLVARVSGGGLPKRREL